MVLQGSSQSLSNSSANATFDVFSNCDALATHATCHATCHATRHAARRANKPTATCRPIQLCSRMVELGCRLVGAKERMVLQGAW